ncbi:MAG: alpha-L-fucosidase [Victivallales bacterium]
MADYGHGDLSWWSKSRFGMFLHFGLYSTAARQEWVRHFERISNEAYQKYFDHFDPDLFDADEWAYQAKKAGMQYAVLTAKHHEGFCLWDSQYTDYKITNTPFGRDLVREYCDAFRKHGIHVGLYYSLIDWHHPEFTVDSVHPLRDEPAEMEKNASRDMRKYAQYMRDQVTELLTGYGKIDVMWFDFSYPTGKYAGWPIGKGKDDWESEKLVKLIRSLQNHVIIDDRLDLEGAGDFRSPEQYIPSNGIRDDAGNLIPWEGCQTFSGAWGYHRGELAWKEPKMLIEMLVRHVSRGGNLLMNVGPTGRGDFDPKTQECLAVYQKWMKHHERAIRGCTVPPEEFPEPEGARYTYNPETKRLYLCMFEWPFKFIHLSGLAGHVEYAQLLNDASEIPFRDMDVPVGNMTERAPKNAITLELPVTRPDFEVPVIELFLKDSRP